jgi:hypothetical protein
MKYNKTFIQDKSSRTVLKRKRIEVPLSVSVDAHA